MYKVLTIALICVVTFNTATRASHGELVKKQAVYPGYIPQYVYQDSHYYPTQYPQSQVGVVAQGQSPQITSGPVSTTGSPVKQVAVSQKSGVYSPTANTVSSQYPYPFRQYYPQIYPQNSQYPSVPSVFYVPSQGRFPAGANENTEQGSNAGGSGGSSGSWFGNNWSQNFPSWGSSSQSPQFPSFPSNIPQPQYPSNLPQYPANFPQFPNQYPQFPSSFPSGNLPNFPSGNLPSFPSGNFPAFPGASPAGSAPGGASPVAAPGSEAGASGTTNTEGNSVVVVGARRPEKIENADSTVEGTKNDADKVASDFPPQQYILLGQPQYVLQNGGQVPVVQNAAGKEPTQLDSAAKGAVSSFLIQPQSAIAQQSPVQQFPHIPHNKIFSPQEFQELIQQIQLANKKVVESNNVAAPQFYVQQGVLPQRGVGQQFVGAHVSQGVSGQQSQDIPSQQFSGLVPQQYILQGVPASPQVQQPYLQFSPQQQQLYVPQFASLPQQKPFGEVSSIPGASSAYQRFLLENQKPVKSTVVGNQNVEGGASVSGSAPTPVSISPSVSPTATSNDSSSSPEPSNNDENESAGNTSGSKN